jgi:hypothetical protein
MDDSLSSPARLAVARLWANGLRSGLPELAGCLGVERVGGDAAACTRNVRQRLVAVLEVLAAKAVEQRCDASSTDVAAPAPASDLAVPMPMPDAPPVTMMRCPVRSSPSTISSAVVCAAQGVVMCVVTEFSQALRRQAAYDMEVEEPPAVFPDC